MTNNHRACAGFTLVELITVIGLLGILSAVAIARSGSSRDFEPRRFVSMAAEQYRFTHGLSSGRFGDTVSFSLSLTGTSDWQFLSESMADGSLRRETLSISSLNVSVTNGATTITLDSSNPLRIEFSASGDVLAATVGAQALLPNQGIQISVSGDSSHSVCVYPTGYLGNGNCG